MDEPDTATILSELASEIRKIRENKTPLEYVIVRVGEMVILEKPSRETAANKERELPDVKD